MNDDEAIDLLKGKKRVIAAIGAINPSIF